MKKIEDIEKVFEESQKAKYFLEVLEWIAKLKNKIQEAGKSVITSYSIHYTKLYESSAPFHDGIRAGDQILRHEVCHGQLSRDGCPEPLRGRGWRGKIPGNRRRRA